MSSNSNETQRDLERYYLLMTHARWELRQRFTGEEIGLICEAYKGWQISDPVECRDVAHCVSDAIVYTQLYKRYEISNLLGLIDRLKALTWVEAIALYDMVERFWRISDKSDGPRDPRQALA